MKKILLFTTCLMACMGLWAQEANAIKVAITSATATSQHSGNEATNAIDGNTGTIWHTNWSSIPEFPVTLTLTLREDSHVDFVRYIPRQDGSVNGRWDEVTVAYSTDEDGDNFINVGTFRLNASQNSNDLYGDYGTTCRRIRFTIQPGGSDSGKNFASAAEIEVYDYSKVKSALSQCFTDDLYTELKSGATSEDIEEVVTKTLVDNMLADATAYKKFRVGEYKAYMPLESLKRMLGVNSYYSAYENPTGVYLKKGESCLVMVEGIGEDPVNIKMKNWLVNEESSSYKLRNGFNYITALTEGNLFVDYYTDNYKNAPAVKIHFINAPVQGYWDHETMTAADWTQILRNRQENDSTILVVQSKHVQVAYPVFSWKQYCAEPNQVDSLMTMYQQILWAERDMLGVEKYKIEYPNRQFSYVVKEFSGGAMAAGGEGTLTPVYSMEGVMSPDGANLWVWGLAHEFGHTNQINPGLRWSGCIEVTNNIYSSWAELHVNNGSGYLRLEDEVMTNGEFRMRGGRMQAYFEEGLRKKLPWMLHEGQDFYKDTPKTVEVDGFDADGNSTGKVTVAKRNYDHFVKLAPFWQLNLWGTMAERCPDIIPMTIQGIRTQRSTSDFSAICNTAGKEQMNWMKLACDSAKINLLPFFEKAGMLRPINVHIDSWNIITEEMINELKAYVASKGYPTPTEEINYINGHNYHIYRDELALEVPATMNDGCTVDGDMIRVQHDVVKNAVAFETYNIRGELIRITMYGLGSDDNHSYTQVLFPSDATYIMAVGYDGTRTVIYSTEDYVLSLEHLNNNTCYTVSTQSRGSWYSEDARLNGTLEKGVAYSEEDVNQQFAFLKSSKGNYYLYSVAKKKFVKASGNYTALTDNPEQIVTFSRSTGDSKADYPWVIALDDMHVGVSTGYSPDVITFYNSLSDGGNMVRVKAVAAFDAQEALAKVEAYESSAKYIALQSLIETYEREIAKANTGVGTLTATAASAMTEVVNSAKQLTEENSDEELQAAIDELDNTFKAAQYVLPSSDKFYIIKSAIYDGGLVYANVNNRIYWSNEKDAAVNSETIWKFEEIQPGTFKLYNVHNAQYISELGWSVPSYLGDNTEYLFTIVPQGGGVVFLKGNNQEMHAQGSGTGGELVRYNTYKNGSASSWIVEEVSAPTYTFTVGATGWASLVLGFNASIPQDVKVYTVSSAANGYANLSEVTGVLPANTAVLINAPEGKCDFIYSDDEPTTVGDNLLQGKPYNAYVEGAAYVLANGENGVGLYKAALNKDENGETGNTHFLNNANKAYLVVEGANAPMFSFNRGTTSIDNSQLTIHNSELVIYDITGRRVEKMEKGIYIVNGKKVVIK